MNKSLIDPGDASPRKETDASEMIEKIRERHKF